MFNLKCMIKLWSLKFSLIMLILLGTVSLTYSQTITGSIKGVVLDEEGNPLPGVSVTTASPSLQGTLGFSSTAEGIFRFSNLPPGIYEVTAKLSGFQTVRRANVVVYVGKTTEITIEMKPAVVEEEILVTAPSPVVDTEASKVSVTMTADLLRNIPMARDLFGIIMQAPGVISGGSSSTTSIHGGTVRANIYALDGVNMNDPAMGTLLTPINFDVIEEVQVGLGAHPAEIGVTDAGYINVVTKSGGNTFRGGFSTYYTSKELSRSLIPEERLTAAGLKTPVFDKINLDFSGALGGPIIKDRLWFFANARRINIDRATAYIPWTDPFGQHHPYYDWE